MLNITDSGTYEQRTWTRTRRHIFNYSPFCAANNRRKQTHHIHCSSTHISMEAAASTPSVQNQFHVNAVRTLCHHMKICVDMVRSMQRIFSADASIRNGIFFHVLILYDRVRSTNPKIKIESIPSTGIKENIKLIRNTIGSTTGRSLAHTKNCTKHFRQNLLRSFVRPYTANVKIEWNKHNLD